MDKKISNNEKITRKISEVHSADNYLTKETTENVSLAVTKLSGKLASSKISNERNEIDTMLVTNGLIHDEIVKVFKI